MKNKNVHRVVVIDGKREIIKHLLEEYDISSAQDIQSYTSTASITQSKMKASSKSLPHTWYWA